MFQAWPSWLLHRISMMMMLSSISYATAAVRNSKKPWTTSKRSGRKLDNDKGGEDAAKAGRSLSRADVIEVCHVNKQLIYHGDLMYLQMAIEAMSTVQAIDCKPGEIEIGIVSNSEEEDEKVWGKWLRLKSKSTCWLMQRKTSQLFNLLYCGKREERYIRSIRRGSPALFQKFQRTHL